VLGVGPVVVPGLSRGRHHRRHEDEQLDRHPLADERSGEAAPGVRDDDEAGALADGGDDGVGVVGEPGRLVLAREVHGHRVVPASAELGSHEVPVPRAAPAAVDQDVRAHRPAILPDPLEAGVGPGRDRKKRGSFA
jgi:hypothetical protein